MAVQPCMGWIPINKKKKSDTVLTSGYSFDEYLVVSTETAKTTPVSPALESPYIKKGKIKLQNRLLTIDFHGFMNAVKKCTFKGKYAKSFLM